MIAEDEPPLFQRGGVLDGGGEALAEEEIVAEGECDRFFADVVCAGHDQR